MQDPKSKPHDATESAQAPQNEAASTETPKPERLDPTRYGDWEMNGRCIDF